MSKVDRLNDTFGFSPSDDQHHFLVLVPSSRSDDQAVTVFECPRFEEASDSELPVGCLERVRFTKVVWKSVAEHVRAVFNLRLKEAKRKTGKWHLGPNFLAPHYGKELVLLGWALEDVPSDKVDNVFQNWRGLAPEERWWLYSTANAPFSQNSKKGRGIGWRKALTIAMSENPLVDLPGETGRATVVKNQEMTRPERKTGMVTKKKVTSKKATPKKKKDQQKITNKDKPSSSQADQPTYIQGSLFDL